jgi:hypothetical protein
MTMADEQSMITEEQPCDWDAGLTTAYIPPPRLPIRQREFYPLDAAILCAGFAWEDVIRPYDYPESAAWRYDKRRYLHCMEKVQERKRHRASMTDREREIAMVSAEGLALANGMVYQAAAESTQGLDELPAGTDTPARVDRYFLHMIPGPKRGDIEDALNLIRKAVDINHDLEPLNSGEIPGTKLAAWWESKLRPGEALPPGLMPFLATSEGETAPPDLQANNGAIDINWTHAMKVALKLWAEHWSTPKTKAQATPPKQIISQAVKMGLGANLAKYVEFIIRPQEHHKNGGSGPSNRQS